MVYKLDYQEKAVLYGVLSMRGAMVSTLWQREITNTTQHRRINITHFPLLTLIRPSTLLEEPCNQGRLRTPLPPNEYEFVGRGLHRPVPP